MWMGHDDGHGNAFICHLCLGRGWGVMLPRGCAPAMHASG